MGKSEKNRIARGIALYTVVTYIGQFISLVKTFLVAKFLAPIDLGVVGKAQIIFDYSQYMNLGATYAFDVRYPMLRGEGNVNAAARIRTIALKINAICGFLLLIFGIVIYFVRPTFIQEMNDLAIIIGMFSGLQVVMLSYRSILRAMELYNPFSTANLIFQVFILAFVLLVGSDLTPALLFISMSASALLTIIYSIHSLSSESVTAVFVQQGEIKKFLFLGASLLTTQFAVFVMLSTDRVVGSFILSPAQFGLFTFAYLTVKASAVLTSSISTIIYPVVLRRYSSLKEKALFFPIMERINIVITVFNSVLLVIFLSIIPFLVNLFLPNYVDSMPYIALMIPTLFFTGLPVSCADLLFAQGKQKTVLIVAVIATVFSVCMFSIFQWLLLLELYAVPVITISASAAYGILIFIISYRIFIGMKNSIKSLIRVFVIFIIGCLSYGFSFAVIAFFIGFKFTMYGWESIIVMVMSVTFYFAVIYVADRSAISILLVELKHLLQKQ